MKMVKMKMNLWVKIEVEYYNGTNELVKKV